MSTIDPTKNKPLPPIFTPKLEPTKASEKKATSSPVDHEYSGPPVKLGALFAPASPPASAPTLAGTGVSQSVFGPKNVEPRKMTDAALADGIERMGTAIRKNPGKVNDDDLKQWSALVTEAATRTAIRMGDTRPAAELTNRELFGQLLAFDAAEASGVPLNAQQAARKKELTAVFDKRGKFDVDGEIAYFQKVRDHAKKDMKLHCAAAGLGALGLATHSPIPGGLAAGAVVYEKLKEGKKNEAYLELTLAGISLLPWAHKPAEIASTTINASECATATQEYFHATHKLHELETLKKAQEAKAQ